MKLSAQWIRDFVDLTVDDQQLAEDLTAVGIAVESISGLGADCVFEMEIGTNRPDAMNHYGVAREAAAIYDLPLKQLSVARSHSAAEASPTGAFPITVEEPALCPRFSARVIHGTKIKPSPEKIAHRLQLLDQRPISNAVDATNYVLWQMGKPTHVFDMGRLEGRRLIIRRAKKGEKLKTLDGVERTLTSEDLVVADAKKPVGLAGVMGGFDTMITDKTTNILIESAWWDPLTVRKTARRHGIHTDASHRFERGADFESTTLSCALVAELILSSGGGELIGDVIDVVSNTLDQAPIILRLSEVHRILAGNLKTGEIFRILKKLGFGLIPEGQAGIEFEVRIPSWRLDVEREIDLIEEIARMHGYDKFENTLPAYSGAVVEPPNAATDLALRERVLALGYNEAISLSFISHEDAERFSAATVLELENPLSAEASVMRTTMVPGMLDMLAWNLNRDVDDARLFEMGHVYEGRDGDRVEPARACLGATAIAVRAEISSESAIDISSARTNSPSSRPNRGKDGAPNAHVAEEFRSFKGDVENSLSAFAYDELTFDRQTAEYFHPERSARVLMDGAPVAQFGQIAESVKSERKLRQNLYLAEFDLDQLRARGLRKILYKALAKFPVVERDFSFVFPDAVEFLAMRRAVSALRIAEVREFKPVEIFRGRSIGAGKYSILLRVRLQSEEATLRDEQIAQWSEKIVGRLRQLGGVQRA
jgi:phenylalanyl-tRNA synthetase beta chain